MGLQSHFQWFTQLDEKLNIQPDIAKLWTISPDAKPILYVGKDIYFKSILFGNDSTRTVNASDFEYSLNRLLMKSRFSRRLGFTKRRKLQSRK
jgi:peptide/nickel transport system substrate-binding protein